MRVEPPEIPSTDAPVEMMGDILHWKVLLKYIKEQCKDIGEFVLQRNVVRYFVPNKLHSAERKKEEQKVMTAIEGLERTGYIARALGVTKDGTGVCITLLKYAGRIEIEQDE